MNPCESTVFSGKTTTRFTGFPSWDDNFWLHSLVSQMVFTIFESIHQSSPTLQKCAKLVNAHNSSAKSHGVQSMGVPRNHPSHAWPWLSLETHGDLGIPHFKNPHMITGDTPIWMVSINGIPQYGWCILENHGKSYCNINDLGFPPIHRTPTRKMEQTNYGLDDLNGIYPYRTINFLGVQWGYHP